MKQVLIVLIISAVAILANAQTTSSYFSSCETKYLNGKTTPATPAKNSGVAEDRMCFLNCLDTGDNSSKGWLKSDKSIVESNLPAYMSPYKSQVKDCASKSPNSGCQVSADIRKCLKDKGIDLAPPKPQ